MSYRMRSTLFRIVPRQSFASNSSSINYLRLSANVNDFGCEKFRFSVGGAAGVAVGVGRL